MKGQVIFSPNGQVVIAFDNTPDGDFAVAKARIDAFKQAAARLGLPITFGGEVERHIPDDSHQLLHQHGVSHHH